jgi:sugar lactone lactonase YvrE
MEGIGLGESPRWRDGRLWFCDWLGQGIVAVDPSGRSEIVARVTSLPFSIDWLPDGTLLVTSGRSLMRVGPDGSVAEHADLSDLSPYGWNEIVVDARGNAFVNSPGFDMMAGAEPAPGIVAVLTPDGAARRVADGVAFPNGMAVTPDDATLIVADSYGRELAAFDVADDGGLSNRRVWADLGDGVPDGICIDAEGAVWYADVPNRRCVRVREGGEVLDAVEVDRGCFACMLGGPDGATLFVMAQEWRGADGIGEGPPTGRVLSVRAPAPHAGRP